MTTGQHDQDTSSLAVRFLEKSTHAELEYLLGLSQFVESRIVTAAKGLFIELDEMGSDLRRVEREELRDEYAEVKYMLGVKFPSIQRSAIFLSAYAVLESTMNGVCGILRTSINVDVDVRDLRGMGIERAKLYLSKVGQVVYDWSCDDWKQVRHLNEIRNSIVHREGVIDLTRDAELRRYVEGSDAITVDQSKSLQLSAKFVPEVLGLFQRVVADICRSANSRISGVSHLE